MNENTVFSQQQNVSQKVELESPPLQNQNNQVPLASPLPPVGPPGNSFSELPEHSGFDFSSIIKIVSGILFFILIGFLSYNFLIPKIFQNKEEKITLTYWGLWEDKKAMQVVISDFEKQNPNIKINYIKEDIKQYRERLITRINSGNGPDIFRFHNTWLPMFLNILAPLPSDIIKRDNFQTWFYPVVQRDVVKNGAIYGIPLEIDTLSLFANMDSFKAAGLEVPKTWDDFSKAARSLTVKDEMGNIKNSGAALGTYDNISNSSDIVSMLMIQNGANLKNLSETSQAASDALSFYASFAQGEEKTWDDKLDPSVLSFAKGNLSMCFGYSWDIFMIKSLNPSLNFAVFPVPALPNRDITIASYWVEGVSIKSKHQKEALLFLKFLSQKETEQKLFTEQSKTRLFGEPYARTDLSNSLKSNSFIYPFVSQAQNADSSFFAQNTFDNGLNSQMNNYLGNAVRSILDNTSPQSAVDTLSKGVFQVLSQYEPKQAK